jgi:hypothetical protein
MNGADIFCVAGFQIGRGYWMREIKDELKARFGRDYSVFLWYWCIDVLMLLVLAMLYVIYFSPWVRQTLQIKIPLGFLMPTIFLILILMNLLALIDHRKWKVRQRLKGTRFVKWIEIPVKTVFVAGLIGSFFLFDPLETQPIDVAIHKFGYPVKVPTYLPFRPTYQYGWVDEEYNQIQITYENDKMELDLYVRPHPEQPQKGEEVKLPNGTKAVFSVDEDHIIQYLEWNSDGLHYDMELGPKWAVITKDLPPKPKPDLMIKIAQSFQFPR